MYGGGCLGTLLSCEVGLGESVDVNPPKIDIDYPPVNNAFIKQSFYVAGPCSDDKGMKEVQVRLTKKINKTDYETVNDKGEKIPEDQQQYRQATLLPNDRWSIEFNKPYLDANGNLDTTQGYNGWSLPDGDYIVYVKALDGANHDSGTSPNISFSIDNTPPLFILTKPGIINDTGATQLKYSEFGSVFKITGTLVDDCKQGLGLEVSIFDKDGKELPNSQDVVFTENDVQTAGGMNVQIARFIQGGSNTENTNYNKIYFGSPTESKIPDESTNYYTCQIKVYDSAKVYAGREEFEFPKNQEIPHQSPRATTLGWNDGSVASNDGSQVSNNGNNSGRSATSNDCNITTKVFLNDSIYNDLLSVKTGDGLSAEMLNKIMNKTADEKITGDGGKEVISANVLATLNAKIKDTSINHTAFSLDPNSKPKYSVTGMEYEFDETGSSDNFQPKGAANGYTASITTQAGLDNVLLMPQTFKVWLLDYGTRKITKNDLKTKIDALSKEVKAITLDEMKADDKAEIKQASYEQTIKEIKTKLGFVLLKDYGRWTTGKDETGKSARYTGESQPELTFGVEIDAEILQGSYYYIVVTGADQDEVEFANNNYFGFIGQAIGTPPILTLDKGLSDNAFTNASDNLIYEGTAKSTGANLSSLVAKLSILDESKSGEAAIVKEVETKAEWSEGNWTCPNGLTVTSTATGDNWKFDLSKIEKYADATDGVSSAVSPMNTKTHIYNLEFALSAASGTRTIITRNIKVDTVPPEFNSAYIKLVGQNNTNTGSEVILQNNNDNVWFKNNLISIKGTEDKNGNGKALTDENPDVIEITMTHGTAPTQTTTKSTINTTSTFNASLDSIQDGFTNVELNAIDKAGNSRKISLVLRVDTTAPVVNQTDSTISKTAYNNADKANNTAIAISVKAEDATSGLKNVILKKGSTKIGEETWTATGSDAMTVLVPIDKITKGDNLLSAFVEDKAGNISDIAKEWTVVADFDAPTIKITSHGNNAVVNKTVLIKGSAQDSSGVKAGTGKVQVSTNGGTSWTDDNAASRISPNESGDWTYSLDTTKYVNTATQTSIKLRVLFTDTAGNEGNAGVDLKVDQNADRPIIQLTNILINGSATSNNAINGNITDDDGDVQGLWYWNEGGSSPLNTPPTLTSDNGWTKISVDAGTGSWKVSLDENATAEQKWYFYAIDAIGNGFATKQNGSGGNKLQGIYLKDAKTPQTGSGSAGSEVEKVEFYYDKVSPTPKIYFMGKDATVTSVALNDLGWKDMNSTDVTFGKSAKLWVKVVVDENAAMEPDAKKAVTLKLGSKSFVFGGTTPTSTDTANKKYTYLFGPIDLTASDVESGSLQLATTALDMAGLSKSTSVNIIVDKEAPTVNILSPIAEVAYKITGSANIMGTVSDDYSKVTDVQWVIPLKNSDDVYDSKIAATAAHVTTENYWHPIPTYVPGSSNWTIGLNGSDTSPDSILYYINQGLYRTEETSPNSGVYKVPIWFRVTDSAGNTAVCKTYKKSALENAELFVYADPDAGKPTVEILSPDDGTHTSGEITILGTAKDIDGSIKEVHIKITGRITGGNKEVRVPDTIIQGGKESWRYTYDSSQTFVHSGETTARTDEEIFIQVQSFDNENKHREWTPELEIKIDPNSPIIQSVKVVQYGAGKNSGNPKVEKEYISDMYISGNAENRTANGEWYLLINVTNDHNNPTGDGVLSDVMFQAQNGNAITCDWSNYSLLSKKSKTETIQLPLKTSGTGGVGLNGKIYYKITIFNQNQPTRVSTDQVIRINVDSNAPTVYTNQDKTYFGTPTNGEVLRLRANPVSGDEHPNHIGTGNDEDKIVNSNKWFTIGDELKEDASELNFIAMSLIRYKASGTSGKPKVYGVINKTSVEFNNALHSTTAGNFKNAEGLPCYYVPSANRPNTKTVTISGTAFPNALGSVVKIGGEYNLITAVSGNTYTLKNDVPVTEKECEFIYTKVINNLQGEALNDNGQVDGDDGDGIWERLRVNGSNYEWRAMFDSTNIADGPLSINIIAVDKAGNITKGSVSTQIQNNRPRIAKVLIGTDLNGNGTFDYDSTINLTTDPSKSGHLTMNEANNFNGQSFGEFNYYSTLSKRAGSQGEAETEATIDAHEFKVLTELCILPEFVGGNNGIGYVMKTDTSDTAALQTPSTGTVTQLQTGSALKVKDFKTGQAESITSQISQHGGAVLNATGGNLQNYIALTFWDKTEELQQGQTSQKAFLKLQVHCLSNETEKPVAKITPFYWNSKTDSSVYIESAEQGHIDLEGDLPTATFNGTGEMDRDPKVSGKIKIEGELSDNVRLGSVSMSISNFQGFTNLVKLANYTSGQWVKTSTTPTGFESFNIEDVSISQKGHFAKYTLVLDTEKVTGVAKTDCVINVSATDWIPNTSTQDTPQTPTPSSCYKMDVVPYIKKIDTFVAKYAGSEFAQSAQGYYDVRIGNASSDGITVSGYNMPASASSQLKLNGTNFSGTGLSAKLTSSHKSGEVSVVVNGVESLNNKNANPTWTHDGTAVAPDSSAKYNSFANGKNNDRLTDDIKLHVWDMGYFIDMTDITDPMMKMASDGSYYMIYDNNMRTTLTGTATRGAFQLIYNLNGTAVAIDGGFNKWINSAMALDRTNKTCVGASTNSDRIGNDSSKFKFYTQRTSSGSWSTGSYTSHDSYRHHLETSYNSSTNVYNINRVARPRMVAKANGSSSNVYMTYFDANHTQSPIKFRYGTVSAGSANSGLSGKENDYTTTESSQTVTDETGSAANFHIVADDTTKYKGGTYAAVEATSAGVALVAWYDASERRLVYSWNDAPGTPVAGGVWQTNAKVIDSDYSGWYVDMFVDSADGIHIAYYDSGHSNLKYAYAPSYNGNFTVVTVDSYLSCGTQIAIETRDEVVGSTTYIVPYISYYHSSFAQSPTAIRVAYMPSCIVKKGAKNIKQGAINDKFTGNWEVSVIPTINIPKDAQVCIGLPATNNATYGKSPVIGYMSDTGYEKAFIKW